MKYEVTEALRHRLVGLGYRMLGIRADAEDIVQEAEIRLHARDDVENTERFMFRVVSRLCIDRLRHERVVRAAYVGPWLPEPVPTPDPGSIVELADDIAVGFLLLLERMTPAERVVYVLREAFEYSFDEIGEVLETNAANCRQRLRRAKARLVDEPRSSATDAEVRPLLEQLVAALMSGSVEQLIRLLTDDATLLTDGGGKVPAAIAPVVGSARIVAVLKHLTERLLADGKVEVVWSRMNGGPGLLLYYDGALYAAVTVTVEQSRIRQIFVVRNPDKLGGLAPRL